MAGKKRSNTPPDEAKRPPVPRREHVRPVAPPPVETDWGELVRKGPKAYGRFDEAAQERYLTHLAKTGRKGDSCAAANVCYQTIADHREKNPEFAKLADRAYQQYCAKVESEITRRAIEGVERPIYQQGELVGFETVYSDKLLELHAKRHIREYTDRTEVNANVAGGVMVMPAQAMSEDDWESEEGANCRHDGAKQ